MSVKVVVQYDVTSERDDALACAAGLAMHHKYGVTVQQIPSLDHVYDGPLDVPDGADIERRLRALEDKVRGARRSPDWPRRVRDMCRTGEVEQCGIEPCLSSSCIWRK